MRIPEGNRIFTEALGGYKSRIKSKQQEVTGSILKSPTGLLLSTVAWYLADLYSPSSEACLVLPATMTTLGFFGFYYNRATRALGERNEAKDKFKLLNKDVRSMREKLDDLSHVLNRSTMALTREVVSGDLEFGEFLSRDFNISTKSGNGHEYEHVGIETPTELVVSSSESNGRAEATRRTNYRFDRKEGLLTHVGFEWIDDRSKAPRGVWLKLVNASTNPNQTIDVPASEWDLAEVEGAPELDADGNVELRYAGKFKDQDVYVVRSKSTRKADRPDFSGSEKGPVAPNVRKRKGNVGEPVGARADIVVQQPEGKRRNARKEPPQAADGNRYIVTVDQKVLDRLNGNPNIVRAIRIARKKLRIYGMSSFHQTVHSDLWFLTLPGSSESVGIRIIETGEEGRVNVVIEEVTKM